MAEQGVLFALTGKASDAVRLITSGINTLRSTGTTFWTPPCQSYLAKAHAELGQFDDAWCCIGKAMTAVETTEKWFETEVHRMAGEIALMSREPDAAKACKSQGQLNWRGSVVVENNEDRNVRNTGHRMKFARGV